MKKFTLSALACMLMGVFTAQAQLTESFDVTGTPAGWTVIDLGGPGTWEFGPLPGEYAPHSGDGAAFINWSQGHDDYLITPQFTVTTGVSDQLRFYSRNWGTTTGFNNQDMFNVELSIAGNEAEDFTIVLESEIIPPTQWTEYIYNLSQYAGQEVYIAFRAVTDGSQERLYLDDVYLEAIPNCPKPSQMAATIISETEAIISWTENGSATQWEVVYGAPGFDPATSGVTVPANGSALISLTGLTPVTHYDYYVRAICAPGDESMYSVKASFFTGYCPFISTTTTRFIESFSTQNGTGNISNLNSGLSPNGYGDHTDMVVTSYAGGSFDFNTVMNNPEGWMTYTIAIWIDFNDDMVFDESEQVFIEHYVSTASGTIEIPDGTPNGNYRMRVIGDGLEYFVNPCTGGEYAEAEDYTLTLMDAPSCLPASGLQVVNLYAESADLDWTANTGETNWEVLYGETGFDPATEGTTLEVTGSSNVTLTELDENTQYQFYVTAICSGDDASSIAGPVSFRTLCLPTVLPYNMNFEDAEIPAIPLCTSQQNTGSGNDWETFSQFGNGFAGKVLRYKYDGQFPGDAWFYTQAIELESGTNYVISYKYGNNNNSYTESMKVAFGSSPLKSAMVNQLAIHWDINAALAEIGVVNFTVPSTGVYYFGFNAFSAPNQFDLYLDDINISEGFMCYDATDIGVSNITGTTATVSWTASTTAAQGHEVNVFLGGDDPATETAVFTETYAFDVNEADVTGLTANTTYDVYITSLCGGLATSTSNVVSFTTDDAVGVSNYDVTNINYFPNPVKDQLTITAGSAIESVTVYNLLGAAVMQMGSRETDVVLDMSSLPAGAYILKASVAEGVSTFKVIKE